MAGETDPKRRIAAVKDHPGWEDLVAEWRTVRERRTAQLGRSFMAGKPLNQREIDLERGFWRGVEAVLMWPDQAETRVKKLVMEGENVD